MDDLIADAEQEIAPGEPRGLATDLAAVIARDRQHR